MDNTPKVPVRPLVDLHYITAIAQSGLVVFTVDECNAAQREIRDNFDPALPADAATNRMFSNTEKYGIHLGLTANVCGEQQFFAAYTPSGFYLGMLNCDPENDSLLRFDRVSVGMAALAVIGTEHEELGRKFCEKCSVMDGLSANGLGESDELVVDQMSVSESLRSHAETIKKSLHLTRESIEILTAGGKQSGRVNAILSRYAAIAANPDLAVSVAESERIEREIVRNSKN